MLTEPVPLYQDPSGEENNKKMTNCLTATAPKRVPALGTL